MALNLILPRLTDASRGGVRLGYESAGDGEPPMIFVHGWCGDLSYFAPQAEHFARRHAVVAADLRGHGSSDAPEPGPGSSYDIAELADDVHRRRPDAGHGRVAVSGITSRA
jgi:pimeloyl-ACP methyl ester carboxylesterase